MQQIIANIPLTCALIGVIGILYSLTVAVVIKGKPAGGERMQQIASAIQEGAIAYLKRQAKSMGIVGLIIAMMSFVIYRVIMPLKNLNDSVSDISGSLPVYKTPSP